MVAKRKTSVASTDRPAYWDDPVSPRRQAIFAFIRKFVREHGYAPTTRDVTSAFDNLSADAVRNNLRTLERVDYVRPIADARVTRWSPTGERALKEARLWELVDQGSVLWSGGKPKGSVPPLPVQGDGYVSDFVHQDRR